jgi:hypothetical protein
VRTNLILTPVQLQALGLLVGEFARVELTLDLLIMHLARLSPAQYATFMQGKMLNAKLTTLKEIGTQKLRSQKRKVLFKSLVDTLADLNGQRTVAVHGLWQPKGGYTLALFAKGFSTAESEAVHKKGTLRAERLVDLVKSLDDAHTRLYSFWKTTWLDPGVQRSLRRNPPVRRGGKL